MQMWWHVEFVEIINRQVSLHQRISKGFLNMYADSSQLFWSFCRVENIRNGSFEASSLRSLFLHRRRCQNWLYHPSRTCMDLIEHQWSHSIPGMRAYLLNTVISNSLPFTSLIPRTSAKVTKEPLSKLCRSYGRTETTPFSSWTEHEDQRLLRPSAILTWLILVTRCISTASPLLSVTWKFSPKSQNICLKDKT